MSELVTGTGTKEDPWNMRTPPGKSQFTAWLEEDAEVPAVCCMVSGYELRYKFEALQDLADMLKERGDWMLLGNADENKPAKPDTVEAWARDESNPVGGWYGLRKGYRGRFANCIPPIMEHLGLAEVEHNARNNRMRAI